MVAPDRLPLLAARIAALAAGFGPLAVAVLGDQICTTAKWTSVTTGNFPESRSGQYNLAYDPPNQRYRQNETAKGNETLIADYKNNVGYSHHVCDPVPELRIQFRNRGFETIP
jgi:hypothetical protein